MDVISLLRLLKDLLPPEVYANIVPLILGAMESTDAVLWERMYETLVNWARQNYPQYERLIRMIMEQVRPGATPTPPPPPPPPPPRPPWWRWGLRGGLYLALAYLLVAAVADRSVTLKHEDAGTGPCSLETEAKPVEASESATGPKQALKDAMDEIQNQCVAKKLACSKATCPTCGPDAAIQTVEVKTRIFWYTADVTARCQCWCKAR